MNKFSYMKELFKKLFLHINIVNYVICDLFACVWFLFYRIMRYIFFNYNNYSSYHRLCDMEDFEIQGSAMIVVVLFTPWAMFVAYVASFFVENHFMLFFLIAEIIIALSIFYSIYSTRSKCYSIKRLERFRGLKLQKWRLNVFCLLLVDIIFVFCCCVFT